MQSQQTDEIKLAFFQTHLIWENTQANFEQLTAALTRNSGTFDLLVLPEMYSTGFTMSPQGKALNETVDFIQKFASLCRVFGGFLAGSFVWKEGTEYRNRFLLFNENGICGFYDKRNLFGVGGENNAYSQGGDHPSWEVRGWKLAPYVCYDLRFPEWCRNSQFADLMLFTANWPEKRKHHWRTLLLARGIENQCYVMGVNRLGEDGNGIHYCGGSIVSDANGEVLLDAESHEGIFSITLSKDKMIKFREKYPFLKDRNQSLSKL